MRTARQNSLQGHKTREQDYGQVDPRDTYNTPSRMAYGTFSSTDLPLGHGTSLNKLNVDSNRESTTQIREFCLAIQSKINAFYINYGLNKKA